MSPGTSQIRILAVDDHPIVRPGDRRSGRHSGGHGFGRRGIQRARCHSAIPNAPPGCHVDGLADAGN